MPTWSVKAASIVCGGIYVMSGIIKVFPLFEGVTRVMEQMFTEFATVFPLVPLGITPDPVMYMKTIGLIEIITGAMLIMGSTFVKKVACIPLAIIMVGAIQTQACLEIHMVVPPALFLGALGWIYMNLKTDHDKKS